jgi:putative transposase
MVLDADSRAIIGSHEVHVAEPTELAAPLLRKASMAEDTAGRRLVLHSDNGSLMRGPTRLATTGIMPASCDSNSISGHSDQPCAIKDRGKYRHLL